MYQHLYYFAVYAVTRIAEKNLYIVEYFNTEASTDFFHKRKHFLVQFDKHWSYYKIIEFLELGLVEVRKPPQRVKNDSDWENILKNTFPEKFYGKCFTFVTPPTADEATFHSPMIFQTENKIKA